MRLFVSSLNSTSGVPVTGVKPIGAVGDVIENTFIGQTQAVQNPDVNGWIPFYSCVVGTQDRIYMFFTKRTGHDGLANKCWVSESLDDGETWSDEVMFFDANTEVSARRPDIFYDGYVASERAIGAYINISKTKIFVFVYNMLIDDTTFGYRHAFTTLLTYDLINNDEIDFNTKVSYDFITIPVVEDVYSRSGIHAGAFAEKDGVLYTALYSSPFVSNANDLYRSFNDGVTWERYSSFKPTGGATEMTFVFIRDTMYASARGYANDGQYIGTSTDLGLTWTYDPIPTQDADDQGDWIRGGNIDLLPDGMIMQYGNDTSDSPSLVNRISVYNPNTKEVLSGALVGMTNNFGRYFKNKIIGSFGGTFFSVHYNPITHQIEL